VLLPSSESLAPFDDDWFLLMMYLFVCFFQTKRMTAAELLPRFKFKLSMTKIHDKKNALDFKRAQFLKKLKLVLIVKSFHCGDRESDTIYAKW
jgi:hypothetical protein